MTPDESRLLRELADKQAIHDLLMRYCRGVDRCDASMITDCFHDDAIDDHGNFIIAGKDTGIYAELGKDSPGGGMHFIGNVLIEVEGDTAFAESYFMALHDQIAAEPRMLRIRAARYVDRLERRDGRWGIVERLVVDDWNQRSPIGEVVAGPELFRFGTRGSDDPVFAIKQGRVARDGPLGREELVRVLTGKGSTRN